MTNRDEMVPDPVRFTRVVMHTNILRESESASERQAAYYPQKSR